VSNLQEPTRDRDRLQLADLGRATMKARWSMQ
jgi:hypothetical protein